MTTTVGVREAFTVRNVSRESLQDQCGVVMDALLAMESDTGQVSSPAVSLDLATSTVTIEVDASGTDFDDAAAVAERCIHSAIRKAAGAKPERYDYEQQHRHTELADA